MFNRFYPDADTALVQRFAFEVDKLGHELSMAALQNHLLTYRRIEEMLGKPSSNFRLVLLPNIRKGVSRKNNKGNTNRATQMLP
jgi:hypothetical protein